MILFILTQIIYGNDSDDGKIRKNKDAFIWQIRFIDLLFVRNQATATSSRRVILYNEREIFDQDLNSFNDSFHSDIFA